MKVRKNNPRHWVYLGLSGLNVVAAGMFRGLRSRDRALRVGLYGHTFNGNLKALADAAGARDDITFYFSTIDPEYARELRATAGVSATVLNLLNPRDAWLAASVDVIITDRDAQTYELLKRTTSIPFIDVWHGMPYKGFTPVNFAYLRQYREVWTSSSACAEIYARQLGVPSEIITPTGYARTDMLANRSYDVTALRERYAIADAIERIVLVAPTWQQDDKGRSIIPFGVTLDEFFAALDGVGRRTKTLFIFRAHLNVQGAEQLPSLDHVRNMPYARFPVVEDFLAMSDVLVTDWSSMAFDFLPLRRPTIFLDVPPPFKDGFTIGPEHRFGDIVDSLPSMIDALERNLRDPESFESAHAAQLDATRDVIYGDTLDGKVTTRQLERLEAYRRR